MVVIFFYKEIKKISSIIVMFFYDYVINIFIVLDIFNVNIFKSVKNL